MILTSPVIQDIEVEHGTIGISLSQNGDNILMSEDQLKQFISAEIAKLREAGEKMAKQLKDLRGFQEETEARGQSSITIETEYIFNTEDADALEAWEAANK